MRIYKIADTTVTRTLKACGLSTAKKWYSEDEIKAYFDPARRLFSSGYTVREVEEFFSKKVIHVYEKGTKRRVRG